MSLRRPIIACVCAMVFFSWRGDAAAQVLRLSYEAPEGCSDGERFRSEVTARTPLVRFGDAEPRAGMIAIVLSRTGAGFTGRVEIRRAGPVARREVSAESCAEVVSALALITALAIDPRAITTPAPNLRVPAASSAPVAAARAGNSASTPGPAASSGSTREPPTERRSGEAPAPAAVSGSDQASDPRAATAQPAETPTQPESAPGQPPPTPVPLTTLAVGSPPPPTEPPPEETTATAARARVFQAGWRREAGVELTTLLGPAPDILVGGGLFWEARHRRASLYAPSLRVSVSVATAPSVDVTIGAARFVWAGVRIEGCPLRFGALSTVSIAACAGGEMGTLHASGISGARINETISQWRPWVSLAALGQLELMLPGPLDLALRAGVTLPVTRDTFYFMLKDGQPSTIHEVPAVGAIAGVAVGIKLP